MAGDGAQALAALERRRPDVALLDWEMPGLDGLAVTARVRAHPALADLPVVLVTARQDPEDLAAGLAAGADDFLIEPVHQTVLEARLAHVLRRASRRTQLRDAARHDPLTGLPNRRAWEERLGHASGDRLLTGVADAWRPATPATTSVGLAAWDGLEDAHALTCRADAVLHASKRAGRDRVTSAPGAPVAA